MFFVGVQKLEYLRRVASFGKGLITPQATLDTLAEWIQEGVISGSWERSKVETLIPVGRIHPMSIQLKRSGAGRIIIDMSAPRGRRVRSINAMIKDGMEEFPISMCDAGTVLRMVTNVECIPTIVAAKADWDHVYKHIPVCLGDAGLQFVSCGGKLFVDLSLVFGASSSPSVFDQVAAIVLYFSVILAGVSSGNTGHQLDDAFFIGLENKASSWFAVISRCVPGWVSSSRTCLSLTR